MRWLGTGSKAGFSCHLQCFLELLQHKNQNYGSLEKPNNRLFLGSIESQNLF